MLNHLKNGWIDYDRLLKEQFIKGINDDFTVNEIIKELPSIKI